MNKIQEYLGLLGWTEDMLEKHLETVYKKKLRDRIRYKKYFNENKDKLYAYHENYRKNRKTKKKNEQTISKQIPFNF